MLYFELSDLYQFNIKVSIFMFKILFSWRSNCSVKMFLKSFVGKLLIRQMFSHAAAISSIFCYLIYINLYWSIYITLYLLNAYLILSYNPEIKIGFIWAFLYWKRAISCSRCKNWSRILNYMFTRSNTHFFNNYVNVEPCHHFFLQVIR